MGKGKKKGGAKFTSIDTAVSSLTLAESEASTSQAVEEEDVGLTGGGRKKKPQKVPKKPEPAEEKKDEVPAESPPTAPQPEPTAPQPQPTAPQPQPTAPQAQPCAPQAKPDPPKEAQEEEEPAGLGLTGGTKKPRIRKKKSAQAAQPTQPAAQAAQQPAPVGGQAAYPATQGLPQGLARPAGTAQWGAPPPGWGAPAAAPAAPASAPWQRPAASTQAQGPALAAGQGASSGGRAQDRQQPAPPGQAQAAGDKPKYAPLPMSRQQIVCKYSIPAKIIGKSVHANKVKVITNYLPMTIKPIQVHRYDVTFAPDKPRKMIPDVYKIVKDRLFPNEFIAFDMFKNAYSLNLLKKNNIEDAGDNEGRKIHTVDFPDPNGRIIPFKVSFKHTGSVDFTKLLRHIQNQGSSLAPPMEEIQCIDVILRQGTLEKYVKCGRNFFKRPERPIDLSGGLEMWTGLFQSAIFTSQPYINIDVAHKGFPIQQSLLDAWKSFNLDLNKSLEQQMGRSAEGFKDFLKNLKVVCKLAGGPTDGQTREYMVNTVKEAPTKLSFTKEDGRTMTVYDYYLKEKKYKIRYPHLPCLWVGVRNKSIYYPLELCTVVYGQPLRKQLNEFQLATMVREAATPPEDRKRKIEEVARNMNYSQNTFFKKFGLEISNQFLEVEAKVLTAPTLNCGESKPTNPWRGAWNSQKLLKPEALVSWGFIGIELAPYGCNFDTIKSFLVQTGSQLGMQVAEPKMVQFNVLLKDLRALLFKALEAEIRFLFVIVPTKGRDYYHKVKQFAERDVGILTQCVKEYTATRRMTPQTIKNILLKVNSKLMGINQCLDVRSVPRCIAAGGVMIVGADVTHPSPDQQNIPSIAAVTASIDPKCFIYNIEMSIQSPKEEVISQFEDMMCDHLRVYLARNGNRPPKKIYVFRDGVSEGQFGSVMNRELTGLLNAYAKFSREKPEVLFLLVQKRHHTRLFGTDQKTRKIVNVEPGTVVDTHIVHPKELDFYLVSHAAIKGTARPTRYHSVCNDGGIPHDEVEQLTYYLCHLYSRCMRAVSYPTPTYYAHLACLRARSLTHGALFDNSDLERNPKRLRVLEKMLRSSRMFFV